MGDFRGADFTLFYLLGVLIGKNIDTEEKIVLGSIGEKLEYYKEAGVAEAVEKEGVDNKIKGIEQWLKVSSALHGKTSEVVENGSGCENVV